MKFGTFIALVAIGLASWLPYLGLNHYWGHLQARIPGSATGEVSGSILYFLPRLFWAGVAGTAAVILVGARSAWLDYRYRNGSDAGHDGMAD